ncbi:putative FAD/NAD(P)-binding domain-containing protein [Seiridium cardinale]|uniref:FAD/NAD(P)-binding domain-containing protein n=1 Tax=Seiridium cardinale TaxID=138064 RepID=A0ABR2XVA7_9PEZI
MRAAGHDAMIFERSATLGGTFASSAVYPGMHLTVSNWFMAFSDFPDPTRLHYSSAEEYLRYLHSYCGHFRLEKYINYNSEVCDATLENGNHWSLRIRQTGNILQMQADALIVATGNGQVPRMDTPEVIGFQGRVIHSSQYNDDFKREVAEKKSHVLIVGAGESSADISAELSELSPHITVWVRRAPLFGPRYLNDSSTEMEHVKMNKTCDYPANRFTECSTTNRMGTGLNVYSYGLFRRFLFSLPVLDPNFSRFNLESTASSFVRTDQTTWVTKSARIYEAVTQNTLEVLIAPNISIDGQSCRLATAQGSAQRDLDAIVLCTGFRTEFPWLHLPDDYNFTNNPRTWFLHCFPDRLGHCLFFVGYARPQQGGIPAMAEMLSRYIALLLSRNNNVALPEDYGTLALRDMSTARQYYSTSPDLHSLVDYNAFLESVARRVGCEPRLPIASVLLFNIHMLAVVFLVLCFCGRSRLSYCPIIMVWIGTALGFFVVDNGLAIKWWFYANWSVWYRQRGPGANPKLFHGVLKRVRLLETEEITTFWAVLALWTVPAFYLQRLLSILLFVPFAAFELFGLDHTNTWFGWLRPKIHVLHRCPWRVLDLFLP